MLVAKKENYTYSVQNNHKDTTNKKMIKTRKQNNFIKAKVFFYSTTILVISLVIILRLAYISQIQYEISKLDNEITELQEKKEIQNLQLDKIRESRWIEESAINLLAMEYPSNDRIIYISTDNIQIKDNSEIALKTQDNFEIYNLIKNSFNKLLILLNIDI